MNPWTIAATLAVAGMLTVSGEGRAPAPTTFRVRVENVSKADTLKTSTGTAPAAVAPVLWVVHTGNSPVFAPGERDRGKGLEPLAEDGNPAVLAASLKAAPAIASAGVVNTPEGASAPGPILAGSRYEFTLTATPGARLTLAMMFGQSNDVFYASDAIDLFKDGRPLQGDVTSAFSLWDAGTEINQEPGTGADQAPRQKAPNTGAPENAPVRRIEDVKDGFTYPAVAAVVKVTLAPEPMTTTRR